MSTSISSNTPLPSTATNNTPTNTIDTSGGSTSDISTAQTQLFNNTQDFIKMLTVQLQNQDPTKPLETDQLTQQIASLSQVEQQINTNKNLQSLMASYAQSQVNSNVNYIGKLVETTGNQVPLTGGEGVIVYNLDTVSNATTISISDSQGNVVYNGNGTTLAGRNQLIWDGTKNDGTRADDGVYTVAVNATAIDNTVVKSTTETAGMVTALETQNGVSSLALGNGILVTTDKVTAVRDMPVAQQQADAQQ